MSTKPRAAARGDLERARGLLERAAALLSAATECVYVSDRAKEMWEFDRSQVVELSRAFLAPPAPTASPEPDRAGPEVTVKENETP